MLYSNLNGGYYFNSIITYIESKSNLMEADKKAAAESKAAADSPSADKSSDAVLELEVIEEDNTPSTPAASKSMIAKV